MLECEVCNISFMDRDILFKHFRTPEHKVKADAFHESPAMIRAILDNKVEEYYKYEKMKSDFQHKENCCINEAEFWCLESKHSDILKSIKELENELKEKLDYKCFICETKGCNITFSNFFKYKQHQKLCLTEIIHKCNNCETTFSTRGNLNTHVKKSCNGKKIPIDLTCNICNREKPFYDKRCLAKHQIKCQDICKKNKKIEKCI
jgi:hypothetical protein